MKAYGEVDAKIHVPLASALVGGQLKAPAASPPGKEPQYALDRRLGGPRSENSSPYRDTNSDPSVVHPAASRYTDCPAQPKESRCPS
jgi:hypothetical protein